MVPTHILSNLLDVLDFFLIIPWLLIVIYLVDALTFDHYSKKKKQNKTRNMYSLPFDFDFAFAHSTCLMHWCWFEKPGNLLTPVLREQEHYMKLLKYCGSHSYHNDFYLQAPVFKLNTIHSLKE